VANGGPVVQVGRIQRRILLIRGEKVIIDADLAEFYGVATKVLNQAVRRNSERFPQDFMFRLTREEKAEVVTNCDHLAINDLINPEPPPKRRCIGFQTYER